MNIFSYSIWQYRSDQDNDVMECTTCGDETGIGYIIAHNESDISDMVNTDRGQQCSSCLAMFLSTTKYDVTPPTAEVFSTISSKDWRING